MTGEANEGRRVVCFAALAAWGLLWGCQSLATEHCADWVCPSGLACAPDGNHCVPPEFIAACEGRGEGDACSVARLGEGLCESGVCDATGCGDGRLQAGEACDDGNRQDGDGCSANCLSNEECGNGLVDESVGETCDDGNGEGGDGCSAQCLLEACGNGRIDKARGEVCDDGNVQSGDGCRADCLKKEVCGDGVLDAGEACDDENANPADGCSDTCTENRWAVRAVLGGHHPVASGDGGPASEAALEKPTRVALDPQGNLYVADWGNHVVRRVDARTRTVRTVAGTGTPGLSGDGGPATSAQLSGPRSVAVDRAGNLYIADEGNSAIRRVDARDGSISTWAGRGSGGGTASGGPASRTGLETPRDVVLDAAGNLYVTSWSQHAVYRVDALHGTLTRIAGTGEEGDSGDGEVATAGRLRFPTGLAIDRAGNVYIADGGNHRIRRVDARDGTLSTVAGTGEPGDDGDAGDGKPALRVRLESPSGVAVDPVGHLYIVDGGNRVVRRVDAGDGTIRRVAGNGTTGLGAEGRPARDVAMQPTSVAVDAKGALYIVERPNAVVRRVDPMDGTISNVLGTAAGRSPGDGGPANSAALGDPHGLVFDGAGQLLIADAGQHVIRSVDTVTGLITTVAGTGLKGYAGDGDLAKYARLAEPSDVALDAAGNLYIADRGNHVVRRVARSDGRITTVAGNGAQGVAPDGVLATQGELDYPTAVVVDGAGHLYIADWLQHVVRRVDAGDGRFSTVAGSPGLVGRSGDGGAAVNALLSSPGDLALDAQGNLYIADEGNHVVRRVDAGNGVISRLAGTGTSGYSGDEGQALDAQLDRTVGIVVSEQGDLYVSHRGRGTLGHHAVRRVSLSDGRISTLAGAGFASFAGDGGPAFAARLQGPMGVAVGTDGSVYVADQGNHVIRRVKNGVISTLAGLTQPLFLGGELAAARPAAVLVAPHFTLFAGGTTGTLQAYRPDESRVEVVTGRYPHAPGQFTTDLARYRDIDFGEVYGVALDATGKRIYLSETSHHLVHVVTIADAQDEESWRIQVLAGTGRAGNSDGAALSASFRRPRGLWLVGNTLYVADTGNHGVRAIDLSFGIESATVSHVAASAGMPGFAGDGGAAVDARLRGPVAMATCDSPAGPNLFIADTGNHRVRRVDPKGIVTTVLGDGSPSSLGAGRPALDFAVHSPQALDCDSFGNLYVTSRDRVKLVSGGDQGVADGSGAVVNILEAADDQGAVTCLTGLDVVDDRHVQVVDECSGQLWELERL